MQTAASGFNFKEVVVSFSSSTDVFVSIFIPFLTDTTLHPFRFPFNSHQIHKQTESVECQTERWNERNAKERL